MASLDTMVRQLAGMTDTADFTDRENDFVIQIVQRSLDGWSTDALSAKQAARAEKLWKKHFV